MPGFLLRIVRLYRVPPPRFPGALRLESIALRKILRSHKIGSPSELPDLPQITAIPEPSSLALLSLGLLSFCLVRLIITVGQRKKFSIFSGIPGKQARSFGMVMTWVGMTFVATPAQAAFINMPDFNNLSAFNLSGSTAGIDTGGRGVIGPNAGDDRVLRLTDNLWQAGSAFYATPFSLEGDASFSSYFEFQFAPTSHWAGADGMVFVIQNAGSTVGTMGGESAMEVWDIASV